MSNLEKFNNTLEDFDKEVGKLKAVSEAYQKLERLIVAYEGISKKFDENSSVLDKICELQKAQQEKVSKSLLELEKSHQQNQIELSKLLKERTDQLIKDNKDFHSGLANSNKQNQIELSKLD